MPGAGPPVSVKKKQEKVKKGDIYLNIFKRGVLCRHQGSGCIKKVVGENVGENKKFRKKRKVFSSEIPGNYDVVHQWYNRDSRLINFKEE